MKFKKLFRDITPLYFLLFAPAAFSEGQVNLYGNLDSGLAYQTISGPNGQSATRFGVSSGMQSQTMLGFRGEENIGNGYVVNFNLLNAFDLNNGNALLGGRLFGLQSWLGVENKELGYFRLGRQNNFGADFFGSIDPFNGGFGQARMGFAFGSANSNTKYSNMIKLRAEPVRGLKVGAGYSFAPQMDTYYYNGNQAINTGNTYNYETTNNTRLVTLGASYNSGPLTLAASYDVAMPSVSVSNVPSSQYNPSNIREWIFGGKYDFQLLELSLAVGQNAGGVINMQGPSMSNNGKAFLDASAWGGSAGAMLFDPNMNFNSYLVGFKAPIGGASKVFGSWTLASPTGSSNLQNGGASQNTFSLGYQYEFTKRTNVYIATSYASNVGFINETKSYYLISGLSHRF